MRDEPRQTYETTQPWVVYTYMKTDAEIPAEGGPSAIEMQCAICGEHETATVEIPPLGTPEPETGYKHPERVEFLRNHVHPLQQTAPETWALPLLNPDAHGDTLDILRDATEKARLEYRRKVDRDSSNWADLGSDEAGPIRRE